MSDPASFHPEVMPRRQSEVLRAVAPVARDSGFYLAGGTGLAIQLGHRSSVDLVWFCEKPFPNPDDLAARMRAAGIAFDIHQTAPGTLHARVEEVATGFISYQYPLLRPQVVYAEFDCPLASVEDIACMKLAAVAQRGSRKDFVDVFAIGETSTALREMLALFRTKYETREVGHVLVALSYFDDAEGEPMPAMVWAESWETMKTRIRAWIQEYSG
ncbi:MAG: nucleotidyl transferase AbiEii/AbiGii toxin family protein [Candidatus Krumholzibacteriia bacterium]